MLMHYIHTARRYNHLAIHARACGRLAMAYRFADEREHAMLCARALAPLYH